MKSKVLLGIGLILLIIGQLLMSFGYDFLMSQRPIDFAHWSLLISAILLFSLWFNLPMSLTKNIGLSIMTIGIGGMVGMCAIDFMLWAAESKPDIKKELFEIIFNSPSIKYPFLIIGPSLFYAGICIATYGLFNKFKWQVICLNIGGLMIGLGHMILNNRMIPVVGAILLLIGLLSIVKDPLSTSETME